MEERVYVIPLRKAFRHVPSYTKTKRAVREVGYFIAKHMKSDNVKIATELSNLMHKHGRKNPPPRIKVKAVKDVKKEKGKKDEEFVMVHSFDYKEKLSLEKKPSGKKEKSEESKKEETKHEIKEVKAEETSSVSLLEKASRENKKENIQEETKEKTEKPKAKKTAKKE